MDGSPHGAAPGTRYRTDDFAQLYAVVTARVNAWAWHRLPGHVFGSPVSPQDRAWLSYLVEVFQQLFEDWSEDPELELYLRSLERYPPGQARARRVDRQFRLAGHVYLHIAFDLPRGLAGSIPASHQPDPVEPPELQVRAGSPAFVMPAAVRATSVDDARRIFMAAAPVFEEALTSREGRALLHRVSLRARLLGLLGERFEGEVLAAIGHWAPSLRSAAFLMAETILAVPPPRRAALVTRLRGALIAELMKASERRNMLGLVTIPPPIFSVAAPLYVALGWVQTSWHGPALAAAGLVIVAVLYWRRRQRQAQVARAVDALGVAMLEAIYALATRRTIELTPKPERQTAVDRPPMLRVHDLSVRNDFMTVLRRVSFTVFEGEIFGVFGPRRAGKTSLLNAIERRTRPYAGDIEYVGLNRDEAPGRNRIARTWQYMHVNGSLDVGRLLFQNGASGSHQDYLISVLDLNGVLSVRARDLPFAVQRRVELAGALASRPRLLLIDETMTGLNPAERRDMAGRIVRINEELGTTIIMAERDPDVVLAVCDRLIILDSGLQVFEGTAAQVRGNPSLVVRTEQA